MLPKIAVSSQSAFTINIGALLSNSLSLNEWSKSITTLKLLAEMQKASFSDFSAQIQQESISPEIPENNKIFIWAESYVKDSKHEITTNEDSVDSKGLEKLSSKSISNEENGKDDTPKLSNPNCKTSSSSCEYDKYIHEYRFQSEETKRKRVIYTCIYQQCGKQYHKRWNLIDHIKTHLGITPYQWDIWDTKFVQKGNLKKHLRQHEVPDLKKRKAYQCPHCHKSYTEKYNLSHHLEKHKKVTVSKDSACKEGLV